jgi:hypothetical protein
MTLSMKLVEARIRLYGCDEAVRLNLDHLLGDEATVEHFGESGVTTLKFKTTVETGDHDLMVQTRAVLEALENTLITAGFRSDAGAEVVEVSVQAEQMIELHGNWHRRGEVVPQGRRG